MTTLRLTASDGVSLGLHQWRPSGSPRAAVQIAHGMAEHGARYGELAEALNAAGYAVYASDHRGHGDTAASAADLGYLGDGVGWRTCLDDLALVRERMGEDLPAVPVVLLGHSMGSFLAQQAAAERRNAYAGLILSGSYRESRLLARAGRLLAQFERLRLGPRGKSALIQALTFGAFNRRFAPTRTSFDWLTRDPAEVDKYMADPFCGFESSVQLWIELLGALAKGLPAPPAHLPVRLITGERDPVCGPDPGGAKLAASLRKAGGERVSYQVYPGARHELFHETNRSEVMRDLIAWLDRL